MTESDYEILQHMMNSASPPDFAVRLLEDVCNRTNLSWKARHVYLQSRNNRSGGKTWQVTLSIDGFRAVGASHPDYAGQEGPYWTTSSDGAWLDIPPDGKPYAAKVGIKKKDGVTTWGVCKFSDYYAGMMWDKLPSTMVAKCAEMLAWRKTFPHVFGGLYGDAEMEQANRASPGKGEAYEMKVNPVSLGESPETDVSRLVGEYKAGLLACGSLQEVKDLGAKIQADKRVTGDATIDLHAVYTKAKKAYEK
jgi:hypothetical protein